MGRSPSVTLVRSRDFSALWAAANFADVGYNLRTMAQAWLIAELFDSQFWVGMAYGLRAGPVVVLALFAGAFIDRFGGRLVLVADRLVLMGAAALTALLVYTELIELWHIVTFGAVTGGMVAFGRPATNSLVPDLVRRDHLLAANSMVRLSNTLGQGLGPALGGLLFAAYGLGSPFLALTALYGLSALLTLRIHDDAALNRSETPQPWSKVFTEIRDGFTYARRNPVVRWMLVLSLSAMFATTWFPTVPFYARDVLNVGEIGVGVLYAGFAVGGATGAIVMSNVGDVGKKFLYLILGAVLRGGGMIVFGYSTNYALSIGSMFAMGFAASLWMAVLVTMLQTSISTDMRGRVMSIWAITMQVSSLGWVMGGVLGAWWGNEMMLLVTGGLFVCVPILVLAASTELRETQ
jgi:DHA3 family tetracycline resistance protein-like MFS transporter